MHSNKNLSADKFQLFNPATKRTGPCKVLEYNPQNQKVNLDFSDFAHLSNISNKFHSSLLKPFTPNDDIHFPDRKLNKPGPVEEYT